MEKKQMEKRELPENVPYIVFEGEVARWERTTKRLIISLIAAIVIIFVSNALWLWAWTQYDYESTTVTTTQDSQGININTVGGGDVNYGSESSSQNKAADKKGR